MPHHSVLHDSKGPTHCNITPRLPLTPLCCPPPPSCANTNGNVRNMFMFVFTSSSTIMVTLRLQALDHTQVHISSLVSLPSLAWAPSPCCHGEHRSRMLLQDTFLTLTILCKRLIAHLHPCFVTITLALPYASTAPVLTTLSSAPHLILLPQSFSCTRVTPYESQILLCPPRASSRECVPVFG